MLNPGVYDLGTISPITTAVANLVLTSGFDANGASVPYLARLEGLRSATFEIDFDYGSGSASGILLIQTRPGGTNWLDIVRIDLAQASRVALRNATTDQDVDVTNYAALSAEGQLDGVLGADLRAILSTTGTYGDNTSLAVRATLR